MLLPYALDSSKNWIHIDDVPYSGRTFDLVCPFCNNPLIAKKGKILVHHFAHEANQSCRGWSDMANYIPPYEGYYVADLSRSQQRVLTEILQEYRDQPFDSDNLRSQTLESLAAKRFVEVFYVPYLYRNADHRGTTRVAQITPRAKAFAHQLSLVDYAIFAEAEHQRAVKRLAEREDPQSRLALKMLHVEYQRWQDTKLYLLEIESDTRTFLKIGITTRPINQRISEVKTFLQQQFLHVKIQPLFEIPCIPYLEGYFKSKFAEHRLEIENATEYFHTFDKAYQEMEDLNQLIQVDPIAPEPVEVKNPERPRFRSTFWRKHSQHNPYGVRDNVYAMLINVTNLTTQERFADWQLFAYGKQFDALGPLEPGDVIEFNAAIVGEELKRPTKVLKVEGALNLHRA